MSEPLELLIVEDHLAVRRGVELLLSGAGFRIAGVAGTVREARGLLERRRHDVALVDVTLSDGSAIELVRDTLERDPDAPIVLYTGSGDSRTLNAAIDTGARGFVLKSAPPAALIEALEVVARGGTSVDSALVEVMAESESALAWATLSDREQEVVELLASGLNGEQIAERLVLSPETIKTHVRNAMLRLGARTRAHAVAIAIRARQPPV
ncbi:MAG: response regulator transcription factor [Solirubrobacteraceae bacterium]